MLQDISLRLDGGSINQYWLAWNPVVPIPAGKGAARR